MRKEIATALFLTTLLAAILVSIQKIDVVRAGGTIYIRSDGSVEGTDKIQRDGNIYTFTDNIDDSIVVERDNIIIDGDSYTLQGAGSGTGLDLSHTNSVTINRTHITEWEYGILCNQSSSITIENSDFTRNVQRAIFLSNSSNNIIRGNFVIDNGPRGIFLWRTNTTDVIGNNVSDHL